MCTTRTRFGGGSRSMCGSRTDGVMTSSAPAPAVAPTNLPHGRRRIRPEVVVIALLLVVVAPFVQPLTAQGAPRVAATGAMVDDGSLVIDGYLLGVDFTTRDGHRYSDKAPGQSLLAAPVYAVARGVGAEPARVHRVHENLTLWTVTLASAVLPLAVTVWLMAAAIRRRGREPKAPVLAGIAFGTMLLPLTSNLYGHVLAGALVFGAWTLLDAAGSRIDPRRAAGAGILAGVAVAVEYQVALMVAVLGVWLLLRRCWAAVGGFALGGLPVAVALAAYQWASTGSAVRTGYHSKEWEGESGFFSTHITHPPSPVQLIEVLVGTRGLLLFTPVVAIAVVGLVRMWRRDRDDGAAVALACMTVMLLLQASWANTWAGGGPGARYVAPALPFLAIGLADVWGQVPVLLRRAALAVSVTAMGLATVTDHLMLDGDLLIVHHLQRLLDAGPSPTVFTIALGPWGWALHAVFVVGVVVGVVWSGTVAPPSEREGAGSARTRPSEAPLTGP